MLQARKVTYTLLTIFLFVLPTAFKIESAVDEQNVATSKAGYSGWSKPEFVEGVNTDAAEYPNGISRDGLSLYFQRRTVGTVTGEDLYVAHRPDLESAWGEPVKLPATINSDFNERAAFISADGRVLYFASDRTGGMGGMDLSVSWRKHVHDDGNWQPAMNLRAVNSVGFDSGPTLFEDKRSGTTQLYFNSTPVEGGLQPRADIYVSTLGPSGFGPPSPVIELNSDVQEGRPYLRRDGLEIFFQSNRIATLPLTTSTIWSSTRSSTDQLWSAPKLAVSPADLSPLEVDHVTTPVLSRDFKTLFVGVVWTGATADKGDIFALSREKVRAECAADLRRQNPPE